MIPKNDRTCPACDGELGYVYARLGNQSMYKVLPPMYHCVEHGFIELILVKGEIKKNVHK